MELSHRLTAAGRHRSNLSSCTVLWSVCTPSAAVGWHHSKLHTNNVPHQKCLPHILLLQNDHRYTAARQSYIFLKCPQMVAKWAWLLAGSTSLWSPTVTKTKLHLYVYNLKLFSHSKIPLWTSHDSFTLILVICLSAWLQQCPGKRNLIVQRLRPFTGLLTALPQKSISALHKAWGTSLG